MKLVFEVFPVAGQQYLLDGKIAIRVIRSVNRSGTVFSIETPNQSILTVEKERLRPIKEKIGA